MALTIDQSLSSLPHRLKRKESGSSLSHQYGFFAAIPDPLHGPSLTPAMAILPGWRNQFLSCEKVRLLNSPVTYLTPDQCPARCQTPCLLPTCFPEDYEKMLPDQVHPFQSCPYSHLSQAPAGTAVLLSKNKQTPLWRPSSMTPCSRKALLWPHP